MKRVSIISFPSTNLFIFANLLKEIQIGFLLFICVALLPFIFFGAMILLASEILLNGALQLIFLMRMFLVCKSFLNRYPFYHARFHLSFSQHKSMLISFSSEFFGSKKTIHRIFAIFIETHT